MKYLLWFLQKHLLVFPLGQLCHFLKYAELRQNDKLFIYLLNKIRVGNTDVDVEKLLKARLIHESKE